MKTRVQLPLYAKASILIVGLYFLVSILAIARDLILPFIYGTISAVLLSPTVDFMVRKRINRVISVVIVLSITLLILLAIIGLLSSQASRLMDALPQLMQKFQDLVHATVTWTSGYFNISTREINTWISNSMSEFINNSSSRIGITLSTMGGVLATVFITPVYIFMILLYQPHLVKFVHKLFGVGNDTEISEILVETKGIIQSYLVGLFIEFAIIALLNSVGLLIIGIDYAILLGITGALLNVIPYLGAMIAVSIYMVIALVTKTPVYLFYILILYGFVQFIDNNFIVPKIIGSKVKLNALISLMAVIFGAALWGIPGMFLSIPAVAIIKLVFDRIEPLKAWGFLLGEILSPKLKKDEFPIPPPIQNL
ncbi:MAG: AI-2E family transporter [Bacteroidia bacterium]